jgi:hypothetical protein
MVFSSKLLTPMDSELKKPVSESTPGATLNSAGHVFTWESGGGTLMNLLAPDFPDRVLAQGQFPGSREALGGVAGRKYSGSYGDTPGAEPDSPKGTTSGRSIGGKK